MGRASSAEHRLLVLGLLQMQEMHGYQLAELIESHFSGGTRIKKATLYDTLRKLHGDGFVSSREEQEGNRPPRTVYALTPEGQKEFVALLRESLGTYRQPDLHGDTALMFLGVLPPGELRRLLEARKESVAAELEKQPDDDPHHGSLAALASRRTHHLRAEQAWLDEFLADMTA